MNRDLSVAALRTFVKLWQSEESRSASGRKSQAQPVAEGQSPRGVRVLEALSATGLRSLRYAKEVAGIDSIIANDRDAAAVSM